MLLPSLDRLEARLFEAPAAPRTRPVELVLGVVRYLYAITRDLLQGDLNMRAMSLVYTTILSIVPFIAFCFAIIKGLGFHHDFEPLIYDFFQPLGDRAPELTQRVIGFVDRAQGGVLGSLGLAFLLWTVISVIQKIEESLNHIWHVERARSLARRISEYLSVLIVGPILAVAAFGLVASLSTNSIAAWLGTHPPFDLLRAMAGRLAPLLLVAGGFTFMYSFVPNTRVRLRYAAAAGLAAAMAWTAASVAFAQLAAYSTRMMAIYASFAIVLLTLMWVWINWLIVLTGALLAFYVQNPQYLRSGQREVMATARLRERLALSVMYLVGHAFASGERRWTVDSLSEQLAVPSIALGPIVDALVVAGLLETTDRETLVPGRDPATIRLDAVLTAVRDGDNGRAMTLRRAQVVAPAEAFCERVEQLVREQLAPVTLRDFIATPATPAAPAAPTAPDAPAPVARPAA
jgi:membrane protein